MRTLEFEVRQQRLLKKKGCDFTGLIAGSVGYLQAKFNFSGESWSLCKNKIARFWINGTEYAVELNDDHTCTIPEEVLTGEEFYVSILGANIQYRIETNKCKVRQEAN